MPLPRLIATLFELGLEPAAAGLGYVSEMPFSLLAHRNIRQPLERNETRTGPTPPQLVRRVVLFDKRVDQTTRNELLPPLGHGHHRFTVATL